MFNRLLFSLVCLLFSFIASFGQNALHGTVSAADTDSLLESVSVQNLKSGKIVFTGKKGTYSIFAEIGHRIVFTSVGYEPDTLIVTQGMLLTPIDIQLKIDRLSMKNVTVIRNYRQDSIARREYYEQLLKEDKGFTGGNRPTNGVGISVSPSSLFSKEAKQKKLLRKRLKNLEQEMYVDEIFPLGTVGRLTQLKGDSLHLFMYQYRPTYTEARKLGKRGITVYVSDKLKLFKGKE